MPEKTAEEFHEIGFFITGDMAKIDVIDGMGYVRIFGRAKDLVISGGFNAYPREVELAIDEMEGVLESAVIGLPDPVFSEAVAAVVVRSTKGQDAEMDDETVIRRLKNQLANFKGPN